MPVIRLLIPFFLGITQQRYWPIPVSALLGIALICAGMIGIFSLSLLPFFRRYKSGFVNGLSVFFLFAALGSLSVWRQDVHNHSLWPGNIYKESDALVIKIREKPSEKPNSLRTEASLIAILRENKKLPVRGNILAYFSKDSQALRLSAGDEIVTSARLTQIPAAASPGAFDFRQYSFFQGITHQVFLKDNFIVTGHHQPFLPQLIDDIRTWVLGILQKAFPDKKERGLAEALLIGYKDELDKTLVQSYTNTGVVHIIAISGLHLGLIYWLLVKLFQPFSRHRRLKWVTPILIITGLWLFTLLAGAQPSVLRSAIMFTCIVTGNSLSRKSGIFNSLALSAFLLLCYNPYWLWDVGFQLSYAAIAGIAAFMKPIYQLISFRNKGIDLIWQMNAVTIAAQLLTLPLCVYHFHQFPNYFLLSNFIAVPLSSLILLLEILLCMVGFIPVVFFVAAKITGALIQFMNGCIEKVEQLPFSVWEGLQISFIQAVLLTVFIITALCCLIYREKTRPLIYASLIALLSLSILRCISFIKAGRQEMIIVYQQAADFITGRRYVSIQFSNQPERFNNALATRSFLRLLPHKHYRLIRSGNQVSFLHKKIVLINGGSTYISTKDKQQIDLVILSQNPALGAAALAQSMSIRQVVADATVPVWRSRQWQQQCDSLNIAFHDVRTKGAFVMKL